MTTISKRGGARRWAPNMTSTGLALALGCGGSDRTPVEDASVSPVHEPDAGGDAGEDPATLADATAAKGDGPDAAAGADAASAGDGPDASAEPDGAPAGGKLDSGADGPDDTPGGEEDAEMADASVDASASEDCAAIQASCGAADVSAAEPCLVIARTASARACEPWRSACASACEGEATALSPVSIPFEARIGDQAFACGQDYPTPGATAATVTPLDFRFFVQDVRLISAEGVPVRVAMDTAPPFQHPEVVLLDFEDGEGSCLQGDPAVNHQLTGTVPAGEYRGLTFTVGVPSSLNHGDIFALPDPLRAPRMQWTWLNGYRFVRAELVGVGDGASIASLHAGSTGCSGDPVAGSVRCQYANRPELTFPGFEPGVHVISADIAPIFENLDLTQPHECHGDGSGCEDMLSALGITTAGATAQQRVFSLRPLP